MALALAGAVLFSAKAVVVKLAYRHGVDPTTLIALRMLVALPFFIGTFLWVARGAPALAPSDHARLVVIGLLGYYAASNLDFVGLQYVSAGLERLILYLSPTLVLSVALLGEPLARTDWLALALSYAGIALAVWHDARLEGERTAFGATLIVGSAVCYALYLVMAGEGVGRIGALRLTSYAMGVSTLAVLVHFALVHPLHVLAQPAPVLWLSLLNGVVCTVVPVYATMLAIERIGAGSTAVASMVGPVATIALASFLLGEAVSRWQLAGTALVLAGVYVLSSNGRARAPAMINDGKEGVR